MNNISLTVTRMIHPAGEPSSAFLGPVPDFSENHVE
jgi:hypothetical protein